MMSINLFRETIHYKGCGAVAPNTAMFCVPGVAGSQLEANLTGKPDVVHPLCLRRTHKFFDLWLNLEKLLPIAIECLAHNLMLQTNSETGEVSSMPGVDIRVSGFGTSSSVEFLDKSRAAPGMYFFLLVENLVKWGLRRDVNITGAPYDFRLAPEHLGVYYQELKALVERSYDNAGYRQVVLIGHSMGNLVALHFFTKIVDQAWKNKYIKGLISIGSPWGGSMKTLQTYASGYNFDVPNFILNPMKLRPAQRTFTSLASLFPTRMAWGGNELMTTVGNRNYTLADMPEFFSYLEYETGWKQIGRLGIVDRTLAAPGVMVHCIFGVGLPTINRLVWSSSAFPHKQPLEIRKGTGDGTVEEKSSELCKHWNPGNNAGKKVTVHRIDGGDHMHTIHHPTTIEIVRQVVISSNQATTTSPLT
ncbi:hypothetical protein RB195_004405 [Necator americanus]|uniref:Lecithin:cholesterol acyltransferase n=1 Tax=Necator americanus TaxID=51031 RepID=A0ABR1BHT0_NECAM